ncbi:MAG: shikimate dehydrogenase [Acidimicrobiales bacterium]
MTRAAADDSLVEGAKPWPSATTRLAGVIGQPVSHSLSPVLHQAGYRAVGVDWAYLAFDVAPSDFAAAIAGAVALGVVGLSVTMPHKKAAAQLATRRSPIVERLGAANTLMFKDGGIAADNTDGRGLVADLRSEVPFDPGGRTCAVIGAGGAARAVAVALAEAGAAQLLIVNRSHDRAVQLAGLVPGRGRVARAEELEGADLIVKATPIGMTSMGLSSAPSSSTGPELVDPSMFGAGQLVVDLVYDPPITDWLLRAAGGGASIRGGLGMLVHQALLQVELWTGSRPPVGELWRAVGRSSGAGS